MREIALEREHVVWALAAMCQLHRVPFDGDLVLRAFPPPYSLETLVHAAGTLGFRVGATDLAAAALQPGHLPCLALIRDDAGEAPSSTARCVLLVPPPRHARRRSVSAGSCPNC